MAGDFTERILREGRERREAEAAQRRAEFFAGRTDIPDLEFLTPECPVCGEPTVCDDGSFSCDGCRTWWPRTGYGHLAERWEDDLSGDVGSGAMGLNIGIEVKAQDEGYMSHGRNPKGTAEEVEGRFFDFLREKFPEGGFGHGWVKKRKRFGGEDEWWDFDVRMFARGRDFAGDLSVMYLAIYEFILSEFSTMEGGLETSAYWSG